MFATPLLIAALAMTPGQIFDGLTGSCWRTDMAGGSTDTHCFTMTAGGKLVMDVHKVRTPNGMPVYEGVTLYRSDKDMVGYSYYNSEGDLYPGTAERTGADIQFGPDLTWRLAGDGYDVISPKGTQHFVKQGPASDGGL